MAVGISGCQLNASVDIVFAEGAREAPGLVPARGQGAPEGAPMQGDGQGPDSGFAGATTKEEPCCSREVEG